MRVLYYIIQSQFSAVNNIDVRPTNLIDQLYRKMLETIFYQYKHKFITGDAAADFTNK